MIKDKLKKCFDFCEKKYNIMMYLSFFIIFMYIYNIGFKEYIYRNQLVIIFNFIAAGILLLCCNFNYIKNNWKRRNGQKQFLIFIIIAFLFVLLRNGDIANHHYGAPFYTLYSLFLIFTLSNSNKWYNIFKNVILIFTFEHIFATVFCYCFPKVYLNNILPLFPKDVHLMLIGQFNAGEIAGITQHYSTNALYLVIGFIVNIFNFEFDKKDSKKIIHYIFLAINFFALLLTGKRVQVFFSLIAILIVIIIRNLNNLKKFLKKFLIVCTALGVSIVVCSLIVPSVLTPFKRTIDGLSKGDLFDSRKPLYNLAINEFESKPIFGQGWGNYKYIYSEKVQIKEMDLMDTHNIYLQVLCELGIIGFIFFIYVFIFLLISSIKNLINENQKLGKKHNKNLTIISTFLTMHIYFLMEGFFGNPLYDVMIYMPYACLLANYMQIRLGKGSEL